MEKAFQIDKFHFNNFLKTTIIGDYYSGFNLENQLKAVCLLLDEEILDAEQIAEMERVTHILAQKEHEGILRPQSWGSYQGRHYLVFHEVGKTLASFEHLNALPPNELLLVLLKLLKALVFANSKEVLSHNLISPDNIWISLADGEAKLSLFGWPAIELRPALTVIEGGRDLYGYFPPVELDSLQMPACQYDLYAIGLNALELATATNHMQLIPHVDRLEAGSLRERVMAIEGLPLPVKELFYKLLTPVVEERYQDPAQALKDVSQLTGGDESGLRFQTFILETLINGRFQLGAQEDQGRVSQVYRANDTRSELEDTTCVVKLIDLRGHSELSNAFHTKFKQLTMVHHEHLLEVYDVGIHFENGFIAMESGLQSLEQLLIKRGTLPLNDAGRITFQICKALEGLKFNNIDYHGAIKPSNIFLSQDLRTVKLADSLTAGYFLEHGNLNQIGAEYFNPEFIQEKPQDVRSDIYQLGLLFFEMMVGHPPFSFKIEQEIIEDHLEMPAANRIEPSLINTEAKNIISAMLEKNPAARYQTIRELKEDLIILLGYDKKEQVQIPNLYFDFAELSMVGKNTREKGEDTLAVRLPAINNRARGAVALLAGEGPDIGDSSRAASLALSSLREILFNPGQVSPEFAKLQKADPEAYVQEVVNRLNQGMYREAFSQGKTTKLGLSAIIAVIQENTVYLHQVGDVELVLFSQGEILDYQDDKWSIYEELTLGDTEGALSTASHERLGFGEVFQAKTLKRRLKDGDQLLAMSSKLRASLSMSELKELINSSNEPSQAVELVRNEAIRRRLEGTISCVLINVGNVVAFAEEIVSHSKKGVLARNFLAQGDSFLNEGRIDEAVEQYNRALEINPNFSIIHHQLGVAYVRKGLSSYGLSCFERALQLNANLPSSYIEMAKILEQQRRGREVLPLLRQAIASGCRDADVYSLLARELIKVRNYDEAILYATEAIGLEPGHPTAFKDKMRATKRRNSLDTKLLKVFGARQRLAGSQTKFEYKADEEDTD